MLWHLVDLTAAGLEVELTYCSNDRETKARKNATPGGEGGRVEGRRWQAVAFPPACLQSCVRKKERKKESQWWRSSGSARRSGTGQSATQHSLNSMTGRECSVMEQGRGLHCIPSSSSALFGHFHGGFFLGSVCMSL